MNNNLTFGFEKLSVWKKSLELVKKVYSITAQFPKSEKYALSMQLTRASVSVNSNIAEGSSRSSKKDKKRFYTIAYGSLMEVVSQTIIAHEIDFINQDELYEIKYLCEEIAKMISGLKNSV